MKLIVGLGNPGQEYQDTRHNAGFMAVDRLAARHAPDATDRSKFNAAYREAEIGGEKCLLLKPLTYMNRSGSAVAQLMAFYKLGPWALLVLVDDTALPLGSIRVRADGSAGGHNGLADIERALGTAAYARVRLGIDPPPPPVAQHDWVLGRFTAEQKQALAPALEAAADAAEVWARLGVTAAMNRFNARPKPPRSEPGAAGAA
ncbi:MAG TPA: aminoacyl-tRNA hydrolase [Phycisphaerales bacterium]|nr:aminoacyl-tRNA hydrolase [Phycisphaerales bacterium]